MAEDINPADLVPFVENPDPTPNYENIHNGMDVISTIRSYVDAIPTPGRDAGDTLGDFSLFAVSKDILNGALTLMEAPYKPTKPEDIFQATLDMGPGMASVATRAPAGAIGMFGSRPGIWASKEVHDKYGELLNKAKHMESTGDPEEKIWEQTGLSKDHENNWRYEISDGQNTKIDWEQYDKMSDGWTTINDPELGLIEAQGEGIATTKLGALLISPKVYEHWPELQNIQVTGYTGRARDNEFGHYNIHTNTIHLNLDRLNSPSTPPTALRRTLIHEAQHALQQLQGRPSGTNSEWAKEQMKLAITRVKKHAENARNRGPLTDEQEAAVSRMGIIEKKWKQVEAVWDDMAAYFADPGEVEASLTELSLTGDQARFHPKDRVGEGIVHPDLQFRPEDLDFPARPTEMNDGRNKLGKTFGTRPDSQSRTPSISDADGANLPANDQRGTLTDDIMDDLSMYQMGQRADRDFYMNYINERMKPFALEMAEPDNANLTPQRRAERLSSRAEEIQIRKGTIRALLGEGDDPSVWHAVRINQDVIRRLEEEMASLSGTQ